MTGSAIKLFFDFLLPRTCFHCGKILSVQQRGLCIDCFNLIPRTDPALLQREFERKFSKAGIIEEFYAPFIFEKEGALQSLIHNLKYNMQFGIGKLLGETLYKEARSALESWNAEVLVPIPLHPIKKADRGYNQSYFIAKGISKLSGIRINTRILKRKRYTETQTQLSAIERKENISGAFQIRKRAKVPSSAILIDDVITTGSTISEAARVMKIAGVGKIFALSLALPSSE